MEERNYKIKKRYDDRFVVFRRFLLMWWEIDDEWYDWSFPNEEEAKRYIELEIAHRKKISGPYWKT